MAVVQQASGTQTATIGTEHTLATRTDGKTYVLVVDLNALANGDVVELRVKDMTLAAGTTRTVYKATFAHAQAEPIVHSIPVASAHEFVATLDQTNGTGRAFPWSLRSLD